MNQFQTKAQKNLFAFDVRQFKPAPCNFHFYVKYVKLLLELQVIRNPVQANEILPGNKVS